MEARSVIGRSMLIDGKKLKAARKAKGWSQQQLADASGVKQQLISQMEKGKNSRSVYLLAIAAALEIPVADITAENMSVPDSAKNAIIRKTELISASPTDKIAVYAAAEGGNGFMVISTDAIDYVGRPSILENINDGYGIYVVGESMVPLYRPGDVLLVHPKLPPVRDGRFVFYQTDGNGETLATVKELVSWNDDTWRVRQHNPPRDFELSRKEWATAHRVVGSYERR
jgi:phage repressor protein C with HTH and peptisase S24 domain